MSFFSDSQTPFYDVADRIGWDHFVTSGYFPEHEGAEGWYFPNDGVFWFATDDVFGIAEDEMLSGFGFKTSDVYAHAEFASVTTQ